LFDLDRELGLSPQAACEPLRRPLPWGPPHEQGAQRGKAAGVSQAGPKPSTRGCSPLFRAPVARGRQPFKVGGGGGSSGSKGRGGQLPSASPAFRQQAYPQHYALASPSPAAVRGAGGARTRLSGGVPTRSRSRAAATMRQGRRTEARPLDEAHASNAAPGLSDRAVQRSCKVDTTACDAGSARSPRHGPARHPLAAHSGGGRARGASKAWR
jgi:hypothetical protein